MIQEIPPQTADADLITVLNVRLRQINQALGSSSAADSSVTSTVGTLTARPVGLTKAAAGSLYYTSDTFQVFWWTGAGWTEITPANLGQVAYASGAITLNGTPTLVTGATLTLTRAGRHLIDGVFDLQVTAGDLSPNAMIGQLKADTTLQTNDAIFVAGAAGDRATVGQQWLYTAPTAGKVVSLFAFKSGGAGASTCNATHTSIKALWIGP